jgi:hypothetical protein
MAFYGLDSDEFDELTFEKLRAYTAWMIAQRNPRAADQGAFLED